MKLKTPESPLAILMTKSRMKSLDAARIKKHGGGLGLNPRCVTCAIHRTTMMLLARTGIDLHEEGITCLVSNCDSQSFHKSRRCRWHLPPLIWGSTTYAKFSLAEIKRFQAIIELSTQKQWVFSPSYGTVFRRAQETRRGERPGSNLVVLDDEFPPTSTQLWEFAIIGQISGNVSIEAIVEHETGLNHESFFETNPFPKEARWCPRMVAKDPPDINPCLGEAKARVIR